MLNHTISRRHFGKYLMGSAAFLGTTQCKVLKSLKDPTIDQCVIKLSELEILERNEGEDDPYFAVLAFRSQLGKAGSTKVWYNPFASNRAWAKNTTKTKLTIPPRIGEIEFADVKLFEYIGIFVLAMEWDNTKESTLIDVANKAVKETEKVLQKEVEQQRGIERQELIDRAQRITQNASANFTFGDFFKDLVRTLGTGVNWDDLVGDNRICMVNADIGDNIFALNQYGHNSAWIGKVKSQSIAMNLQNKGFFKAGKYRVSYDVKLDPPSTVA